MNHLVDIVRREVERHMNERYNSRVGLVSSYDPKTHSIKVLIQPEGQETGWFAIGTQHIGNGWGILAGPQVNDQVEVDFMGGDFEKPRLKGRIHSDQDKPPEVQSGELLFKHEKAGQIYFDKNSNITWTGANGQVVQTDSKGNTNVTLKVSNSGNSDSNSPKLTMKLTDQNNQDHSTVLDHTGIAHSSATRVTVTSPQIQHNGDMQITGSLFAAKTIQSTIGFSGPISNSTLGSPAAATTW